jgi:hypothetical protein
MNRTVDYTIIRQMRRRVWVRQLPKAELFLAAATGTWTNHAVKKGSAK